MRSLTLETKSLVLLVLALAGANAVAGLSANVS